MFLSRNNAIYGKSASKSEDAKKCRTAAMHLSLSPFYLSVLCVVCLIDETGVAAISLLSSFLHEAAHLAASYLLGGSVSEFALKIPAMTINNGSTLSNSYTAQTAIAAAGPLANFAMFILLKLPSCDMASIINFALFLINILPVGTLDGGQILFCILSQRKNPIVSERICSFISYIIIVPLLIIGIVVLLTTKNNFSLLAVGIYLLSAQLGKRK